MKTTRTINVTRLTAGLLSGLLFAILTVPLGAQPVPDSRRGLGLGPVYDTAHETTLNGTIQEVVARHVVGSPAGLHLLVAGPQGVVDAHVGPFLSKETRAALQAGMPVRIVGAMSLQRGRHYLLARELTVGGSTIKLRSAHGLLVRAHAPAHRSRAEGQQTAKGELNGGAR
jgi:hypothetical protein